jgi:hypothetical protein
MADASCPPPGRRYRDAAGQLSGACVGAGGSPCEAVNALLCDGFEGAAVDPGLWTTYVGEGCTIAPSAERPHQGSRSLAIELHANGANKPVCTLTWLMMPPPSFYVRAFWYFSTITQDRVTLYGAANSQMAGVSLDLSQMGRVGSNDTFTGGACQPDPLCFIDSAPKISEGRWVCLEWGVSSTSDGKQVRSQIWVDGSEVTDGEQTGPFERVSAFSIGVAFAPNPTAQTIDAWVDDVALASERIGCAR